MQDTIAIGEWLQESGFEFSRCPVIEYRLPGASWSIRFHTIQEYFFLYLDGIGYRRRVRGITDIQSIRRAHANC